MDRIIVFLVLMLALAIAFRCWEIVKQRKQHMSYLRTLNQYAQRTKDIYVYSLYVGDTSVYERAQNERHLLIASQNGTDVKVHELYFQDGARKGASNETWEQFEQYCTAYIIEHDEIRAQFLASKPRWWNLKYVLRQNGVNVSEYA